MTVTIPANYCTMRSLLSICSFHAKDTLSIVEMHVPNFEMLRYIHVKGECLVELARFKKFGSLSQNCSNRSVHGNVHAPSPVVQPLIVTATW